MTKKYAEPQTYEAKLERVMERTRAWDKNGHRLRKPLKRRQVYRNYGACESWIDPETGMTRYEALTGNKEEHHAE